jgi:isopenicillin-N N-acyltransferase-like protein
VTALRTYTSPPLGPADRGRDFGEHHRTEIARTIAAYRELFAARADHPFDVERWADRAWEVIAEQAPESAEEIAGIADGAGVPVREIAALNARTELLAIAGPPSASECSTVVALPPGQAPVAVQTWDWYDAMADNWLLWRFEHADGRVVETLTEYGVLGKIGVSTAGVGVHLNLLRHTEDVRDDVGFPVHLLCRRILDTAVGHDDAVAAASAAPVSASSAVTVVDRGDRGDRGDRQGRAVSVELFPGGPGLLPPEDGVLVRTNHFVTAEGRDGCQADSIGPGSEIRRKKLLAAFADHAPSGPEEVRAAMLDHDDVGGVCAHPEPALPRPLQHATLATVTLDTQAGRVEATPGGPCR